MNVQSEILQQMRALKKRIAHLERLEKQSVRESGVPGGRLTLTSGTPVLRADVTGATTLYYTPYVHNLLQLYDGSNWSVYEFSELSLDCSGLSNNTVYDVFIYDNAGTLTLSATAWSSATARATDIVRQDGRYVKDGAAGYLYLGSIYNDSAHSLSMRFTGGKTGGGNQPAECFVWNYYNRVLDWFEIADSNSHTYTTSTWRYWNGDDDNSCHFVIGVSEDSILAMAHCDRVDRMIVGWQQDSVGAVSTSRTRLTTTHKYAGGTMTTQGVDSGYHEINFCQYGFSSGYAFRGTMIVTMWL